MVKKLAFIFLLLVVVSALFYKVFEQKTGNVPAVPLEKVKEEPPAKGVQNLTKENIMNITSPAFQHKGAIPSKYTCDGDDVSPPLEFSHIPANASSLALIVDDPDAPAGTWVHWVVFNISPDTKTIGEGEVPQGAVQGITDFRYTKYSGPCPPSGTHRYFFKLYALDTMLNLAEGSSKEDLLTSMEGKVLEQAELIGTYQRH